MAVDVTYERDCLDVSRWRLTRIEKGDTSSMRVWKVGKERNGYFTVNKYNLLGRGYCPYFNVNR